MAKTYYDPNDGKHYYHGEKFHTASKLSDVATGSGDNTNQYNYTPGAEMFREYQRQLEEEERKRPQQQQALAANGYVDPSKPIPFSQIEKQYRDQQTNPQEVVNNYNDKLIRNNGRALNPTEALEYADASLKIAYKDNPGLENLMNQRNELFTEASQLHAGLDNNGVLKTDFNPQYRERYARGVEEKQKAVEDQIKELTGWSDAELSKNLDYANRLQNKASNDAFVNNTTEKIKEDDSKLVKAGKIAKNTATGLFTDALGWAGNTAAIQSMTSKNPNNDILGRDTNTYANWTGNRNAQAQSNSMEQMGKGGQFLYSTGYSAADSLIKRLPAMAATALGVPKAITEVVSLTPYFTQSYNSAYQEARQRGASDEDAQKSAVFAGAIEVATELVPMGNVIKNTQGKNVAKNVVKTLLKEMNEEGLEEAIGGAANEIVDQIIFGNDDWVDTVGQQRYDEAHYDENGNERSTFDTWKNVIGSYLADRGEEYASGFLSAGLSMGGSLYTGNKNAQAMMQNQSDYSKANAENITGDTEYEKSLKATNEEYAKNPVQAFADQMEGKSEESKIRRENLQALADKVNNGEELSVMDNNYVAQAVSEEMQEIEDSNKKGILQKLADRFKGKTEEEQNSLKVDNANVPNEYRTAVTNVSVTEAEDKMQMAANEGDLEALSEAYNLAKNSRSAETRNMADEILNSPTIKGQLESKGISSEEISQALVSTEEAYNKGLEGEEVSNLSSVAQNAYNEGKLKYEENRRISVGVDSDRAKAKTSELSDAEKVVYEAGMKEDTNANQYNMAWDRFYNAGATGLDFEKELKNRTNQYFSEVFDKDTLKSFYEAGTQATQAQLAKEATQNLYEALGVKKASGVFTDARSNKEGEVDFEAYRFLANFTGQDIVLANFDSGNFIEGENAHFDAKNSKIYINADESVAQGFHEALGEFTEFYNAEGYEVLRKSLNQVASDVLGATKYNQILSNYTKAYENAGQSSTSIEMSREMTNDMLVAMMDTKEGRDKLARTLAMNSDVKTANNIIEKIKSLFNNIAKSIRSIMDNSNLNRLQREMLDKGAKQLEENVDLFIQAFTKARDNALNYNIKENVTEEQIENSDINKVTNPVGVEFDAKTDSAYPSDSFSLKTWDDSEYVQDREKAAKELSKALGVSKKKALKYIDDINSIAKMIADDRIRLDFDADEFSSSFVSNTEYGGSIDFSTICKKRLLYTGTLQAIQKQIGNRVITMDDYLAIRNAMLDDGLETTCGCCYVEGSRVKLGQFMKEFIKRYAADNPPYVPNMYDVTMPDGIRQLRAKHPEVWQAREYFLNHMGQIEGHVGEKNLYGSQGKPKDYSERTEYKGEILNKFLNKTDMVNEKNKNGGLRLQSFSDFEIVNLIDCMQVITDMSRCGLAGQAYTKVKEFADALGNTGLKINMSLMGKGVDANGDLILDEVNGMKKEDAIYLRNKYSKNVGTIIVCFNDEQIKAAMKSDYIDFIIPFHRSQWRKSQYDALGLPKGTRDYTMHQNDRIIKENGRLKKAGRNYMPNEYWDFSKSGRENAEKYIEMCNNDHKAPKFPFLLEKRDGKYVLPEGKEYDGYFKLLIDFKMYDNDGVGSEQKPVQPIFSMEECKKMLEEYTGGHDNFPVSEKIAKQFADKIKARGNEFSYSLNVDKLAELDPEGYDKAFKLTGKLPSEQFTNVLKRLDMGENVGIEEIQALPEIQEGYSRIEGRKPTYISVEDYVEDHPDASYKEIKEIEKTNAEREATWEAKVDDLISKNGFYKAKDIVYNGDVAREKRADIVLGLPAAGKSSVIVNNLLQESKALLIDSDEAKKSIEKEYDNGWGAGVVHEESKKIGTRLFKKAVLDDMNIVVPIVGSTKKSINKYLEPLREAGYTVNVHLNLVDATTSMSRLLKRYRDAGRFLDPMLVSEYGNKPTEVYEEVKGDFDGYSKWSNEVRKGSEAKLIEENIQNRMGRDLESSRESGRERSEGVYSPAEGKKSSIKVDSEGNSLTENSDIRFSLGVDTFDNEFDLTDKVNKNEDLRNIKYSIILDRTKGDTSSLKEGFREYYKKQHDGKEPTENYLVSQVSVVVNRIHDDWLKDGVAYFGIGDTEFSRMLYDASKKYLESMGYDLGEYTIKDANNVQAKVIKSGSSNVEKKISVDADTVDFFTMTDEDIAKDLEALGVPKAYEDVVNSGAFKKKATPDTLRQIALNIKNEFGSTYNTNTFVNDLQKFFDYANKQEHVSYDDFTEIMNAIAKPFVASISEKANPEEYKRFVNTLKGYGMIKLTSTQIGDVRHQFGNVKTFRSLMMPIANITSTGEGQQLDTIWSELCDQFEGVLDRNASEGEMPGQLYDALQAFKAPLNPYGGSEDDVTRDVAMRILEEYLGGEQGKKIAERNKAYRDKLKAQYDERLKKSKDKYYAKVIALKKDIAQKAKDKEAVGERKKNIWNNSKKLHDWASKPTKEKHIPRDMVSPIMEFLSAFDFVEPNISLLDDDTYTTRVYVFDGVDEDGVRKFHFETLRDKSRENLIKRYNEMLEDPGKGFGSKNARNWKDRMQSMRSMFAAVENSDQFENTPMAEFVQRLSPNLGTELEDLLKRGATSINNLDSHDMRILDNILKNIIAAVNQGNKAYSSGAVDIAMAGSDIIKQGNNLKERKNLPGALEKVKDMLNIDMLTPRTAFSLLGNTGDKLYKVLRDGLNTKIADTKKAADFMESLKKDLDITDKEISSWGGKKGLIREFNLGGGIVRLTDLQIMALYETCKQPGIEDRMRGGFKVKPIERKGGLKLKQDKAYHLSMADVVSITSTLTDKQKKFADELQRYMAVECAKDGNDVSMKMYGYEMFINPSYFPLEVDKKTVQANDKNLEQAKLTGIRNSGFTNVRKEQATNPLMIGDILDVFTNHVAKMADYHGYAAPTTDILRWFNYKEVQAEDNKRIYSTVQSALDEVLRSDRGANYFKQLLLDINGATDRNNVADFIDYFTGAFKASSVLANLSVVIQQPFAYARAMNMIDPKYMIFNNPVKALANVKKVNEVSPIAWWKAQGYFETNIGRSLKEIITGQGSVRDKINEKAGFLAGKADDMTWALLYQAVENEQRDKLRGQHLSKEEFRQKVNDRFDDMIDQTQVVDSTLHRSQYMRSQRDLHKLQTAFMAEPTKSYNMLAEAILKDTRSGEKNYKRTARAIASWAVASAMTAAAKSLVGAMRRSGDDDEYWDVYLEQLYANLEDNLDPFQMIPWVKDVEAAFKNLVKGESSYGSSYSRYDLDGITELIESVQKVEKFIQGESKLTPYGVGMAIANPLSKVLGVPLYAAARDTTAIYNMFFEDIRTTVKNNTDNKKKVVEAVEKEKTDNDVFDYVVSALENGVPVSDVRSYIQSQYKSDYFEAAENEDQETIDDITNKALRAYIQTKMNADDAQSTIKGWAEESYSYKDLDKAIEEGGDIAGEVAKLQEVKEDDKIIKHVMDKFGETIDQFERAGELEGTSWEENVTAALQAIDATYTYDEIRDDLAKKAKEKAEKAEANAAMAELKNSLFNAIDASNGSEMRSVLQSMIDSGKDAKTIKGYISTEYHTRYTETKDPAERSKIRSSWINATTAANNILKVENAKDPTKTWDEWAKDK